MLELLLKRRSIRVFADKRIGKTDLRKILQAGLLAPSGNNRKPWEFIVVEDKILLEKLSRAKTAGGEFLKDAPLGIVVLGDVRKTDVWIEDTSIALTLMQLAAESLGLGSCWIQMRNRFHNEKQGAGAFVRELLGVPEGFEVEAVLAIGYPDEIKKPHSLPELPDSRVFCNRYGEFE